MQDVSAMKAVMSEWTTTKKRKIMADLVRQTMQYLECIICKDVPCPLLLLSYFSVVGRSLAVSPVSIGVWKIVVYV